MTGRIELRVLGDFQVAHDKGAVVLPPSRKTRALLAYLAVTNKRHGRERLCEMFWDVPDDPRGALRWSLSKIRQVLGDHADALEADRNGVALHLGDRVDYARLAAIPTSALSGVATEELADAAGLISGPFLADLSLDRCADFEAWRRALSDKVEVAEVHILRELVERLHDEPERALSFAQRLQSLLPEDRAIAMEAQALGGAALVAAAQPTVVSFPVEAGRLRADNSAVALSTAVSRGELDREARFCKARDGVRLAYSISGQGSPILRAAHWMSHLSYDWDSPIWRHWIKALSRSNMLVRYDERCNGLSDWNAEDLSFDTMVSDLECVVEAAGLERFTLLGISQSCAISAAYAVRHPERVSGLILYGGYSKGWRARGDAQEIATREALATLMREGWGKSSPMFRQLFSSLFIKGATPEHFNWMDELQRRTMSPQNAWRLQNAFSQIDVSDLLAKVRVPTIVLHARDDAVAPVESGKTLAAEIPGARFVELDSPNHILLEGEPAFDEFMEHVNAFVAETASKSLSLARRRS